MMMYFVQMVCQLGYGLGDGFGCCDIGIEGQDVYDQCWDVDGDVVYFVYIGQLDWYGDMIGIVLIVCG